MENTMEINMIDLDSMTYEQFIEYLRNEGIEWSEYTDNDVVDWFEEYIEVTPKKGRLIARCFSTADGGQLK